MADLFDPQDLQDYGQILNIDYGGAGLGSGAGDVGSAFAYAPTGDGDQTPPPPPQPPAAPTQGGGGFSSLLPSWLGGPSGQARSALPQTAGVGGLGSNSLIGLGLGLMGGNRFDPYGRAIAGYQAGARTDLAARQAEEAAQYHQQELGLRKQSLAQAREIAFKPQIHFQTQEDPSSGYQITRAFLFNPATSATQEVPLNSADKMAEGGKVGVSFTNPIDGSTFTCRPGTNCKEIRNDFSRMASKVALGEMSGPQALSTLSASQMAPSSAALAKDNLDAQGFDAKGRLLEAGGKAGGPLGALAAGKFQGKYAQFADSKENWITAYMMRRGMSTGNEAQRREIDRTFFPQPEQKTKDEAANQRIVEEKRALRAEAEKEIRAAAGPFYRGGGAGAPAAMPAPQARPSGGWQRDPATGNWKGPDGRIYDKSGKPLGQ